MPKCKAGTAFLCLLAFSLTPLCSAKEPVVAKHAMVVAQEPVAADVGLGVLKRGGNAIDAAVAIGFTLAVTHPVAGNLGGGGFMLIRMADGRTAFLDFRECAPLKASRDMYLGPDGNPTDQSLFGWRSAGVPGTVAGFDLAHRKFGTKSWAELLTPAIELARRGLTVSGPFAASLRNTKMLASDTASRHIFLRDGNYLTPSELLTQSGLADTLERLATYGASDFYHGEIAGRLADEMERHGGLITRDDLATYKVIERRPLTGSYKGFEIITAPLPSAGGIGLLQMLGILTGTGYDSNGPDSVKAIHYEAEAMRRFYADRSEYLGDPEFYNVPVKELLSPQYEAMRRASIDPNHATPSDLVHPGLPGAINARAFPHESDQTTHYNVIDARGNAVAVTYTLNNSFGNGITVPGLGFLLNDEMDDFVAKPGAPNLFGMVGGDANAIEPRKRPLSSMTPTIITKGRKPFLVIGAPGGSRITTGVLEVILNILDFHMNAQDAVDLPRFHQQWKPDVLFLQKEFDESTRQQLAQMGYELRPADGVARVEAIVSRHGVLEGGTESRLNGKAVGY